MNNHLENFDYVKEQFIYLKTKVDVDNKLSLYDINNLSESLFSNILNEIYDLSLSNINKVEYLNFPAIDLIDEKNKKVFQVTSTSATNKIRSTIQNWKKGDYTKYELNFFYLKNKPKLNPKLLNEFQKEGITESNLFDMNDLLNEVEQNPEKCQKVAEIFKIHLDTLSFEFNIKNYFNNFESHLKEFTSKSFEKYKNIFLEFLKSDAKVLEIHATGGSGKSHLLKELSCSNIDYIPLIIKKQTNVREDLKKLSCEKKYLFIFDDIDRFLDSDILVELLSYISDNPKTKLILSYRTASKSLVKSFYRKYHDFKVKEIQITWNKNEIIDLIQTINPNISKHKIDKLLHVFNNNPYLITQALKGDFESIQHFSQKIIDDTQNALHDFDLSQHQISEILFKLTLTAPIHETNIQYLNISNSTNIIKRLDNSNVLRKLGKKYRFNPDILGDLYLAYFLENNKEGFEDILENYLQIFSNTVFTNLSYALTYLDNKTTLLDYLKNVIKNWINEKKYTSYHLQLINKIVTFVPEESFLYLTQATKVLIPKENDHIESTGFMSQLATNVSMGPDFNQNKSAINLGSIEPIISKLIYMLKNNYDCGLIKIRDILEYLTSEEVLMLPKPVYSNHELTSILSKLFSPLHTKQYEIILESIDIAKTWIEEPLNNKKVNLFNQSVIKNLLAVTFNDNYSDGMTYNWQRKVLNIKHDENIKIINKVKAIVLELFESNNDQLLNMALDSIRINSRDYQYLNEEGKEFYSDIKREFLSKIESILIHRIKKDFLLLSKVHNIAIEILTHDTEKEEALNILKLIDRDDKFIFYELVKKSKVIIVDYESFYQEYNSQVNKRDWLIESQSRRHQNNNLEEKYLNVIDRLSKKLKTDEVIELFNLLDVSDWNTYRNLLELLEYWFDQNSSQLIEVYNNFYNLIEHDVVRNVLKEVLFKKGFLNLEVEDITDEITIDDLKIYITFIFNNFNTSKVKLLDQILKVIVAKDENTLSMFIRIISSEIYFVLKHNESLLNILKRHIYKLIELQYDNKFEFDSYLLYCLEIIKEKKQLDKNLINLLHTIVHDNNYEIRDYELKQVYDLLEVNLEDLLEIIYNKLISKSPDGYYQYYFHLYMDNNELSEVSLLHEFVKSYDDFMFVVDKSYAYYNKFIEYSDDKSREIRIDLEWFFSDIKKSEYLKKFFSELQEQKDIDRLKVFYTIVPISLEYIDIISNNINIICNQLNDQKIIDYLNQVGKIKSYSRAHMQNSEMLLNEEKFFLALLEKINSFSLQIKIKEILKYIEIEKRKEIESDIERIMAR